ncbi:C_GCAxxG_C_C family protein [Clostridium sp. P21]|uniref:C_GCAxxG_C_C family protein n=1 Tax=Clostridium muellerianum TaxID=2716538 RepID=A0A7Y0HN50_9CLOT|nr:DV_1555 family C-GCAxxG-C-C protein [Clostridium muellerianum]NMM61233.1 C_GCAxxG_C_C family protein [Clostridium muellerianum]
MNDTAFRIYKLASSGFCCTQIMIKLALEDEEKENLDLIRALNGLCGGIGADKKTCGVLTGAIAVIGLYAGKGEATEYRKENFQTMLSEYINWFEEEFESTECRDIIGIQKITDDSGNISYPVKCGDILMKSYEKVQQIISKYGYEFGDREDI